MFISVNRPIVDSLVRVKYTKSEIVLHREELKHEIAKEAMRMMGVEDSLEIVSMADVPAGTGLGSSSCYAVGLLNALHSLKRDFVPLEALAEQACDLEIGRLGKPIGKQDQYMAAFGGIRVLEIKTDGTVQVRTAQIDEATLDDLNRIFSCSIRGPTAAPTRSCRAESGAWEGSSSSKACTISWRSAIRSCRAATSPRWDIVSRTLENKNDSHPDDESHVRRGS
jgi:hypothetical protein